MNLTPPPDAGGATHPGGNVTGLSLRLQHTRVLAADAGKRVWWNPPDAEAALEDLECAGRA